MTDYAALAARLDAHAAIHEDERLRGFDDEDEQRQWAEDLRAAAQLARERAEAPEPVGWMRPDDLQQAAVAPRLCRMHPEKDKQSDMVPVYLHPPAAQPQSEPTYLDPTAVALGLAWSEDGQADSVEPTEYIYIRLKRPEGYEDVHPDLVLEDAHINPAFEAEVVSEPTCKQALQVEPTEAQIERGARALDEVVHEHFGESWRLDLLELASEFVLRATLKVKE